MIHKEKIRNPFGLRIFHLAGDEGFEPPQTESESGVLPLHKSSMRPFRLPRYKQHGYYSTETKNVKHYFAVFLKVFRGCGRHGQSACKLCAQTAYFARFILLQTAAYSAKTIRASSRSAYRQRALCGHAGENYHAVRREDSSCIPFFEIWRSLS